MHCLDVKLRLFTVENKVLREATPMLHKGYCIRGKSIYVIWGICCVCILSLILFFSHVQYACKQPLENVFLLLCLGLIGIGCLTVCVFRVCKNHKIHFIIPALLGLLFFVFQLFAVRSYYFYTKWEVDGIVASAYQAAAGEEITAYSYSIYPNNLLIASLFSGIFRLSASIGLTKSQSYGMLLAIQCLISYASGLITFSLVRKITSNSVLAFLAYLLYLLLIGLSPWVSIPYTDAWGLFFPVAILWLYVQKPATSRMNYVRWAMIGLLALIGYKIKPTVMITFIAIVLVEAFLAFRSVGLKKLLSHAAACAAGFLVGLLLFLAIVSTFSYKVDKRWAMGPAHFFAMGLNEEKQGYNSAEDVFYSLSFDTQLSRARGDMQLAMSRLQKMGFTGFCKQVARKLLTDYSDGSFAWTMEEVGNNAFFWKVREETDAVFSPWIRSFYYEDGSRFRQFINFETALWFAILFLCFLAVFSPFEKTQSVLMMCLAGLFFYNVLFEARARYLYTYGPLYVALAVCGIRMIVQKKNSFLDGFRQKGQK